MNNTVLGLQILLDLILLAGGIVSIRRGERLEFPDVFLLGLTIIAFIGCFSEILQRTFG